MSIERVENVSSILDRLRYSLQETIIQISIKVGKPELTDILSQRFGRPEEQRKGYIRSAHIAAYRHAVWSSDIVAMDKHDRALTGVEE